MLQKPHVSRMRRRKDMAPVGLRCDTSNSISSVDLNSSEIEEDFQILQDSLNETSGIFENRDTGKRKRAPRTLEDSDCELVRQ
jgi:hypothetical protein